ncbi:probable WRKY transcription factor 53, partial [Olea europaea var. sylvestris]|uniref:probable WRKY transcription factor 53 n=1 Tax=Olea europaea var. sylvestris TaxID=158386 RepID=UPI000C1CE905
MEKVGSWDTKIVISELTQGRDLANELKNQLQPAKSREACGYLVEKILSSYDNALSVLNDMSFLENPSQINGLLGSASPRSSDGSDLIDSKDRVIKKRKTLAKWSEQVRVCSGTGLEGPLDDGYNWRKYGQKDILGAKFPRAYYRCTHRNTQGCLATKQIQRTDKDTSIFEVTYNGAHSCIQERLKQKKENSLILKKEEEEIQRHEAQQNMIILKNETQELDTKEEIFPPFEFFSEHIKESNFSANYSPPFLSSTTSESYMNNFEIHHNLQTSETDFSEIISN